MRISSEMLRRGLSDQGLTATVFGNVDGGLNLSLVLFANVDGPFQDGAVYLVEGDLLAAGRRKTSDPSAKIRSVAIISGNYNVEFIRRFETVFIVDEGVKPTDVHNRVQHVFEYYDIWSNELRHLLNTGSDVQGMVDVGTRVFGNPLILQDSNFNVIAVSSEYAGNPSLEPILDRNNIPYLMVSERGLSQGLDEKYSVLPLQVTGRHALYMNIFQQGRFRYRLLVLEMDEELHASAAMLLEFLSGYIQLAIGFVVDDSRESRALPFVMKSILLGEYRDVSFIEQRLGEFGWLRGQPCLCAQIHADLTNYKNRTMRFMSDRLGAIFPEACIFEFENSIVAFFNLSVPTLSKAISPSVRAEVSAEALDEADIRRRTKSIVSALTGFLQDNNMKAGMSNAFSGFEYLRQYYTQAGVAMKLGPRIKPYQWLHRFGDVKELYILESCTENLPARMICDPGLLKLREYDEKHKQDLYHTLYVFLKNNMRSVNAAKELFIHRSTFLYRMERIREITGMNLDSDGNHWYLLLSCKLLELEEKAPIK